MSLDVLLGESVTSWQLTNKDLALLRLSLLAGHLLTLENIIVYKAVRCISMSAKISLTTELVAISIV